MKNQTLKLASIVLLAGAVIAGCSSKDKAAEPASASENQPKKIVVGTGNAYRPFSYLDEKGKLAGYEYEVFKAVDELLPQYTFSYEAYDFKSLLPALDTGKIDVAAHQFGITAEREKNYLFGTVPNTKIINYIFVDGNKGYNFKTLDDLAGKTVQVKQQSEYATAVEDYNAKNPNNKIKILYNDGADEILVKNLQTGIADASIKSNFQVDQMNREYKANLVTTGEFTSKYQTGAYFLYKKGNTELQQAIDGALKKLSDDGTLAKISTTILGADYTK